VAETERRTCELFWLLPWVSDGRLCVGCSQEYEDEGQATARSPEEVVAGVRRASQDCWDRFGVYTAVSLERWGDPDLSVTAVGDRWHFWYLAEDGASSFRSVGDESAEGITEIIFSDFYDIPNAELVPARVAEVVIREWFEHKRLSDVIQWRAC
jgi:hypothetical protein